MTDNTQTWILVAHRAGARVVVRTPGSDRVELVNSFDNPDGRLKDGELETDAPGRSHPGNGTGGGHPMNTEEHASERVAADFARELADDMSAARASGHFGSLVLVAEPGFLGLLRDALDRPTELCVTQSLGKDYANASVHELGKLLNSALDDEARKAS